MEAQKIRELAAELAISPDRSYTVTWENPDGTTGEAALTDMDSLDELQLSWEWFCLEHQILDAECIVNIKES